MFQYNIRSYNQHHNSDKKCKYNTTLGVNRLNQQCREISSDWLKKV